MRGKQWSKPQVQIQGSQSFFNRTRYSTAWGERQNLLRVLYENLKDRSKILVSKDLASIKHEATGVTAICADGSSFSGDILIGADGVFSKTRSQMWGLAASDHADLIEADKNCMCQKIFIDAMRYQL